MKKLIAALSIGFFCVLILNNYFESTEAALAGALIRFHVVANSNDEGDQELKLKVRNRVINEMNSMFNSNGDISAARECVINNMDKIKLAAKEELQKNGCGHSVSVSLGTSSFPTKEYGDVVLPAGNYEALKIEIGKAEGENWWCVLFPPLCFIDDDCVSYTDSTVFASSLDNDKEEFIKKEKTPVVRFKFKAYEAWQSSRKKLACMLGL